MGDVEVNACVLTGNLVYTVNFFHNIIIIGWGGGGGLSYRETLKINLLGLRMTFILRLYNHYVIFTFSNNI